MCNLSNEFVVSDTIEFDFRWIGCCWLFGSVALANACTKYIVPMYGFETQSDLDLVKLVGYNTNDPKPSGTLVAVVTITA